MRVTIEHGIIQVAFCCRLRVPWKMSEEEPAGIQLDIG